MGVVCELGPTSERTDRYREHPLKAAIGPEQYKAFGQALLHTQFLQVFVADSEFGSPATQNEADHDPTGTW